MDYKIREVRYSDGFAVTSIYNYFVKNSWASYLEQEVGGEYFEDHWSHVPEYPFFVVEVEGEVIAWGLSKPYSTLSKKKRTAEISYFILPEHQGKGLGRSLLDKIISSSQALGIQVLLASIMGVNEQSIHFHEKAGFKRVGVMHEVIKKWGKIVDLVWMEKSIGE